MEGLLLHSSAPQQCLQHQATIGSASAGAVVAGEAKPPAKLIYIYITRNLSYLSRSLSRSSSSASASSSASYSHGNQITLSRSCTKSLTRKYFPTEPAGSRVDSRVSTVPILFSVSRFRLRAPCGPLALPLRHYSHIPNEIHKLELDDRLSGVFSYSY